jgi:regulator of protease activity HflC (stomatin/prohibitin superfamily)
MRDKLLEELSRYDDDLITPRHRSVGDRFATYAVVVSIALLAVMFFFPQMIANVYSGEAGVVWDRFSGTRLNVVYGEGVHIVAPWNRFYKYDVRLQSTDLDCEALSRSGLPVKVHASVRFRVAGAPFVNITNTGASAENSLGVLHERIGPEYRDKLVVPVVTAAMRQVLGQYNAEDLYKLPHRRIQDEIVQVVADRRTKEQFSDERTVDIIDVLIRSIALPEAVRVAIEKKMAEEQAMLAYDFAIRKEEREAQRKSIEAEGIRSFNEKIKTLDARVLQWKAIEANLELARSPNAKVVIVGGTAVPPVFVNLPADAASTDTAVRSRDTKK